MPNHVHLILAPTTPEDSARGSARPTAAIPASSTRATATGHLFQARFSSVVMDEEHLMAAARYVAINPVRARLVRRAEDWPWSSARAFGRPRRWAGRGRAADVSLRRALRRSDRGSAGPGAHRRAARRRDDRPPAGEACVSRPARGAHRARSATAEARPQAAACGGGPGRAPAAWPPNGGNYASVTASVTVMPRLHKRI